MFFFLSQKKNRVDGSRCRRRRCVGGAQSTGACNRFFDFYYFIVFVDCLYRCFFDFYYFIVFVDCLFVSLQLFSDGAGSTADESTTITTTASMAFAASLGGATTSQPVSPSVPTQPLVSAISLTSVNAPSAAPAVLAALPRAHSERYICVF